MIEQVLSTLRLAPARRRRGPDAPRRPHPAASPGRSAARRPRSPQRAAVAPARARPAGPGRAAAAAAPKTYTSWRGVPSNWPTQIVQPPPQPVYAPGRRLRHLHRPVAGDDARLAPRATPPSARTSAASTPHAPTATFPRPGYASVAAMGWGVLPTYVGPQAPCWDGGNGVRINPAQGRGAGQRRRAGRGRATRGTSAWPPARRSTTTWRPTSAARPASRRSSRSSARGTAAWPPAAT